MWQRAVETSVERERVLVLRRHSQFTNSGRASHKKKGVEEDTRMASLVLCLSISYTHHLAKEVVSQHLVVPLQHNQLGLITNTLLLNLFQLLIGRGQLSVSLPELTDILLCNLCDELLVLCGDMS